MHHHELSMTPSPDIRTPARKRDRLERSTDLRDALINVVAAVFLAATLGDAGSFLSWCAAAVIAAAAFLQSAPRLVLFFRRPRDMQHRSGREFLAAERDWIRLRMRAFQIANWCTAVGLAAFAGLTPLFGASVRECLQPVGIAVALLAVLAAAHVFRIRKPLSARVALIDRLLAGLDV